MGIITQKFVHSDEATREELLHAYQKSEAINIAICCLLIGFIAGGIIFSAIAAYETKNRLQSECVKYLENEQCVKLFQR